MINSFKNSVAVSGTASSQLSGINSVTAQSGSNEIDEFDMLAQQRNETKLYVFCYSIFFRFVRLFANRSNKSNGFFDLSTTNRSTPSKSEKKPEVDNAAVSYILYDKDLVWAKTR